MSFGFSPSDLVALVTIVTKSYKGWRDACGEYSDITASLQQLLNLIRQVQDEASNAESILTRTSHDKKALTNILQSSMQVTEELGEIINEYRSLGHGKSREKNWNDLQKNWKRFTFGVKDMNVLRSKLQRNVNMISAHLAAAGVSALSRVELDLKALPDEIQRTIDGLASEIRAGRREGSVMTTYDDDEREVWRQFRRELIGEGMRSSMIHRFKPRIKSYLRTLAAEGMLEESQPDLEKNEPDLGEGQQDLGDSQPDARESQPNVEDEHLASMQHHETIENASVDPAMNANLNESSQKTEGPSMSRFHATCVTDDEDEDTEPSASTLPTISLPASSGYLNQDSDGREPNEMSDPLSLNRLEHDLPQQPVEALSTAAPVESPASRQTEVNENIATAAATPDKSTSPNVESARRSYGKERAETIEYPTPDGYKTEDHEARGRKRELEREREREQGRSGRKNGRQHAGAMEEPMLDGLKTAVRELRRQLHEQGHDSATPVSEPIRRTSSVEAVCGSRSHSRLNAVRWSRTPSPVETVYSSRSSSRTGAVHGSREPSPVEAVCGSRERDRFHPTIWPKSPPLPMFNPPNESFTYGAPSQNPWWMYDYHPENPFAPRTPGTRQFSFGTGRRGEDEFRGYRDPNDIFAEFPRSRKTSKGREGMNDHDVSGEMPGKSRGIGEGGDWTKFLSSAGRSEENGFGGFSGPRDIFTEFLRSDWPV